jgi:hypothetical protein
MTAPRLIALRKSGQAYRRHFPDGHVNPRVLWCVDATLAATMSLGGTLRDLINLPSKVVPHQVAAT